MLRSIPLSLSRPLIVSARVRAALFCVGIGLGLFYVVALAEPMAIHNAAHDVRHASGFPCH